MADTLVYLSNQPEIDEVRCECFCEAFVAAAGDALA